MLKKIWQSFMRWFRKSFGKGTIRASERVPTVELPSLDDTDREYLFMQLLEGVAHGWQQPRAIGFFNKIRQRVRKSEWLEWLERFGNNLIQAPVPNYELAGRMVQLGQLDCGEIGDLAGEYGVKLLERRAEEFSGGLLPILEFDALEASTIDTQALNDREFSEVPPELLIDNDPIPSPPSRSFAHSPEDENSTSDTREITLEEFSAMLQNDPDLVAELAEQFGIETTDPQEIVNAVVAQMQQQVQQVSGDLSSIPDESIAPPPPPPELTTPVEVITPVDLTTPNSQLPTPNSQLPTPNSQLPTPNSQLPNSQLPHSPTPPLPNSQLPPPPPLPKLEYKSDDPWSNNLLANNEEVLPETASTPDRGV